MTNLADIDYSGTTVEDGLEFLPGFVGELKEYAGLGCYRLTFVSLNPAPDDYSAFTQVRWGNIKIVFRGFNPSLLAAPQWNQYLNKAHKWFHQWMAEMHVERGGLPPLGNG